MIEESQFLFTEVKDRLPERPLVVLQAGVYVVDRVHVVGHGSDFELNECSSVRFIESNKVQNDSNFVTAGS